MPNFLCVLRTDNEVMCPLATLGDSSSSLARTYPTIFPRSSATCKSVGHETAVYESKGGVNFLVSTSSLFYVDDVIQNE